MAKKEEFNFESLQDCETVVKYLEALKKGFQENRIELGSDSDIMELRPEGLLDFELSATRINGKTRVTLQCGWKEEGGETDKNLKIKPGK